MNRKTSTRRSPDGERSVPKPTVRRWRRRLTAVAVVALIAAVVSASPTAAQDDLFDSAPVASESGGPTGIDSGDLEPDNGIGPVGNTDVATFSVVRPPDSSVPSQVSVMTEPDAGTEWFSFPGDEVAAFIVLLRINSADAATEYRFENAVPADVTVITGDDGSLQFFDADGTEAGFISHPWAFDASGDEVPTRYSIDGTTLIQTVDHHGAAYPVIADPSWWETAGGWLGAAGAAAGAAICIAGGCTAAGVALVVVGVAAASTFVVGQMIPDSSTGGGKRPSNSCNMRTRRGC